MNDHNGADNARALRTDVRAVVDGFTHYTLTPQLLPLLCLVA
jgi:hypothetical protein